MRFSPAGRTMVLMLSLAAVPAFATKTHHTTAPSHTHATLKHTSATKSSSKKHGKSSKSHKAAKPVGQRGIEPSRAAEIQQALIRENYLSGSPSGQWDADTEAAMQKYQADHGWQTKLTPDSRALIKLGLGPTPTTGAPMPSVQTAHSLTTPTAESDTLASAHAIRE